jgi:hypothetical protein
MHFRKNPYPDPAAVITCANLLRVNFVPTVNSHDGAFGR